MKSSNQHILETLIINKDYRDAGLSPKSSDELRKIIEDRYDKLGPGTKQDPIDFNDIDVSNIDFFCNDKGKGIFEETNLNTLIYRIGMFQMQLICHLCFMSVIN